MPNEPNEERIGRPEIEKLLTKMGRVSQHLNTEHLMKHGAQDRRSGSASVTLNLMEVAIIEVGINTLLRTMEATNAK